MKQDSMSLLKESINLILIFIIFILVMMAIGILSFNFLANSETKIYDSNNKYINSSLVNPDTEANYKETYSNKLNFDNNLLHMFNNMSKINKIFMGIFLGLLLLGLIFNYRKLIIENLKNNFE